PLLLHPPPRPVVLVVLGPRSPPGADGPVVRVLVVVGPAAVTGLLPPARPGRLRPRPGGGAGGERLAALLALDRLAEEVVGGVQRHVAGRADDFGRHGAPLGWGDTVTRAAGRGGTGPAPRTPAPVGRGPR